jgi:hypothetical protein
VIEDAVNGAEDLPRQDIVAAVGLPKVLVEDQGKQKLAEVADPDHRQLPQEQARRSSVIRRAHHYVEVREFLFEADKWIFGPIVQLGISAENRGEPRSASKRHDPLRTAFRGMNLVRQSGNSPSSRPSGRHPVDDCLQELVKISADL